MARRGRIHSGILKVDFSVRGEVVQAIRSAVYTTGNASKTFAMQAFKLG